MKNMSLIIINFEGVIGEVTKLSLFDPNWKQALYVKKGVIQGIKRLLEKFQVVLMLCKPEAKISQILSYFKLNGIIFDGVYAKLAQNSSSSLFLSYSEIYR